MPQGTLPLSGRVRVLVVDDNDGFRGSLAALLGGEDLEVVGQASNGIEAIELVNELGPDVVLMDIRMPEMDGIETTRRLKALHPSLEVVALTGLEEERAVREMLVAGASGYVLKDSEGDEIIHAVRRAASGGALLSPDVTPTVNQTVLETLDTSGTRRLISRVSRAPPSAAACITRASTPTCRPKRSLTSSTTAKAKSSSRRGQSARRSWPATREWPGWSGRCDQ